MKLFTILAALTAATTSAAHFGGYAAFAAIKSGQKIPSVDLHSGFPPTMINIAEHVAGRNVIILGLPGAFTPT
jgi:hypothetical protein